MYVQNIFCKPFILCLLRKLLYFRQNVSVRILKINRGNVEVYVVFLYSGVGKRKQACCNFILTLHRMSVSGFVFLPDKRYFCRFRILGKTFDHCVTKVTLIFVAIDIDWICLYYFDRGILKL